ncbi:MAG TPA: pyruvate kinase [Patescibacteria group bacterium]
MRKTKIIATIGPQSENPETIREMIKNGVNVFRFNIKHNTVEWHQDVINKVRSIAAEIGISVAVLVDIPKSEMATLIPTADFVALSYLKNHEELIELRKNLDNAGMTAKIIAKIENGDAIKNLDLITDYCDGVMVARGDLGIEVPIEELAYWQKKIIEVSREKSIPVIVATQMLQSMTQNPTPTRAEATDVANAVFDGTDAIMLSEETAIGQHPVEAVAAMNKIAEFNESVADVKEIDKKNKDAAELLISAAIGMLENKEIKAAVIFSRSGKSVRLMSSFRKNIPILAITNNREILEILNLSYGVLPYFKEFQNERFEIDNPIFEEIKNRLGLVKGQLILVVHGNNWMSSGSTSDISVKELN